MANPLRLLIALSAVLLLLPGSAHADPEVDGLKLKPGDKLEGKFGDEWEPVEYSSKLSDTLVHVKRKGWKFPVGILTSSLRWPAGKGKAAKAVKEIKGEGPAEDPFATDEERAATRKPRSWSAAGGKFKSEATFVRVADGKVVLKRTDGKEISVPLSKLSEADQSYVASLTSDDRPTPSTVGREPGKSRDKPGDDASSQPEIEVTETSLDEAERIDLSPLDSWGYQPDPAPSLTPLKGGRMPLTPTKEFFEKPVDVLLLPNESTAFVVSKDTHPGRTASTKVQAFDLVKGKAGPVGGFAVGVSPIDVSPDGKWVLARNLAAFRRKEDELQLWSRDGNKVTPKSAWTPYKKADTTGEAEVSWARFLDSNRVIACNAEGQVSVWDAKSLKPLFQAKAHRWCTPQISPGGKYIALTTEKGVALLQATDGALAGTLDYGDRAPGWAPMAFSPDATRLAMLRDSQRICVWDLTSGKVQQDFGVTVKAAGHNDSSVLWPEPEYLLVNEKSVVDLQRMICVWNYTGMAPGVKQLQGKIWFVGPAQSREWTFASATVPSKAVRAKWGAVPPEKLFAVQPGMEISIELPADPSSELTKQALSKSLTERGLKVVPKSNLRIVGTIAAGETKTIQYQAFGARGGQTTPHTVTERVFTLTIYSGQDVVWQQVSRTSAPLMVQQKSGQSIDQALAEATQNDSKIFQNFWVPVHIARPNPDAEKDHSTSPLDG